MFSESEEKSLPEGHKFACGRKKISVRTEIYADAHEKKLIFNTQFYEVQSD
jgi:hypothetical protein